MPDMNQIEIPQSFIALFVTAGRLKPNASLELVVGRYELCEDMACMLAEQAQTMRSSSSLAAGDVLLRCHDGLMAGASPFTKPEADWVIRRLAELLAWTPAELGDVDSPCPRRTP